MAIAEFLHTTRDYYEKHAQDYFDLTKHDVVDLEYFLAWIPPTGRVLDAGCGFGRNTVNFLERGLAVDAFDASDALATVAERQTGLSVGRTRIEDFSPERSYDGILVEKVLTHVPLYEWATIIHKLFDALTPGGILRITFAEGRATDFTKDRLFVQKAAERNLTEIFDTLDPVQWVKFIEQRAQPSDGGLRYIAAYARKG